MREAKRVSNRDAAMTGATIHMCELLSHVVRKLHTMGSYCHCLRVQLPVHAVICMPRHTDCGLGLRVDGSLAHGELNGAILRFG